MRNAASVENLEAHSENSLAAISLSTLKGVGPRILEHLSVLGLRTVQDLLFHLPARFQDRTQLTTAATLVSGEEAVVVGEIQATRLVFGRRRSLVCTLADATGRLTLRFFHFSTAQKDALAPDTRIQCFGKVRSGLNGLEMIHPEYRLLAEGEDLALETHLTPVYPTTAGLRQTTMRRLTDQALSLMRDTAPMPDYVPASATGGPSWPPLKEALMLAHRPPVGTALDILAKGQFAAQRRLALEELLAHHLSLRMMRRRVEHRSSPPLLGHGHLSARFLDGLSFTLTEAQHRVVTEIRSDISQSHPMHRLLQGDVGSGKTVVAALAAVQAVEAGHQVAVMAPTELLAEQHLASFNRWLAPLDVPMAWLSGNLAGNTRKSTLGAIASGQAAVVVGTHALFQDRVVFDKLGLVIVDEQHRFGVHQRLALRVKGTRGAIHPHQLIMTATPIPRTLAMVAYADLDISVIDSNPPGRRPVETAAVPETRRDHVIERVRGACQSGRQAYWVCPLIEESDVLQCEAAADTARRLAESLPELRVGLVHGRMTSADKEKAMSAFRDGRTDLLVATTVIEVGVDVPNASLMIVENAERFGLAQLHQLRGRVGRGTDQSACILLYQKPLSVAAQARLATMRKHSNGFEIARRDLELRGPGELLGTKQTGTPEFRVANLARDTDLLHRVEKIGNEIIASHPDRIMALVRRWLGDGVHYGDV